MRVEKRETKKNSFFSKSGRKVPVALTIVATLLLGVFMTGCEPKDEGEKLTEIGIVQIVEHPSLDMIRENIVAELEAQGFKDGETCKITYKNAQNDINNLKTICQSFAADDVNLIVAIATPSAQAALGETSKIPIVFSAVTDPIGAGLLTDLNKPDGNITGTSDKVSATKIMDLALQITPDIGKLGVVYSTGEVNSLSVVEELKAYGKKNNIEIVEATIMNSSEVQQAAQSLVGKVDAVFSPIDNTVATAMPTITDVLNKAKLPFYVSADSMVADGGLATDGVNYVVLGKETGEMAAKILNGAKVADMPVRVMEETQIYVNYMTAHKIGVEIPPDVADVAEDLSLKCPVE